MTPVNDRSQILADETTLRRFIQKQVYLKSQQKPALYESGPVPPTASAVLFLMGMMGGENGAAPVASLILNKRSKKVRQPGDLCFPGGGLAPRLDPKLARLLGLPFSPLTRWPYWLTWCRRRPMEARQIPLLLATSLRESYEEMHLQPLRVQFLGPMPIERLVIFDRAIYPMLGWLSKPHRFKPNWEVDKIISIPLEDLFKPEHYARYRLHVPSNLQNATKHRTGDYPCLVHRHRKGADILWGATFRMVATFLDWVFDYQPPPMGTLPLVEKEMQDHYLTGNAHD